MATKLEKLQMTIGLLDRVSGPVGKITKSIENLTNRSQAAFSKMKSGLTGIVGAGFGLYALFSPVERLNHALGSVSSLGVATKTLDDLDVAATKYSIRFGESATRYIQSSYDIQSAISGLSGNELPRFTTVSGILAKGTKANIDSTTAYVGQMHGIFEKMAITMGRGDWVELLAGQTAATVQRFRTEGPKIAQAFETMGSKAELMGVSMSDQFAILGRLMTTMGGGEAGTKFRAFLQGIGKAQGELGLSFTDSHGRMLPMLDILQKIRDKFGDKMTVAHGDLLMKAFGRKEAVAFLEETVKNIDLLKEDMAAIGKIEGMENAVRMAEKMVSPWQRLFAAGKAVHIGVFKPVMTAITPLIDKITSGLSTLAEWTHMFKNVARWVGYVILTITGMTAALGLLAFAFGMWKIAAISVGVALTILKAIAFLFVFVLKASFLATVLLSGALKGLWFGVLKLVPALWTLLPVLWGFTAALLANPIVWIVVGIAALAVGLYFLITRWDTVKKAFAENTWMKVVFSPLYLGMELVDLLIEKFERIPVWWENFKGLLANLDPFSRLTEKFSGLLSLIDLIPGIDLDLDMENANREMNTSLPELTPGTMNPPGSGGGLMQEFTSNNTKNRSVQTGDIHIHNQGAILDSARLSEELAMVAP
uniref:Phage tail tape measure protein, TP901 family, core region n=1 Tax=Candidatus Kentrum sp. LFY TaxID=2126342 RepID=A0A450WI56_9GAMM|nr:MAG: phage tail tape measure protein, TP901 family, core region [Candidatus Kentron sp. LFY]